MKHVAIRNLKENQAVYRASDGSLFLVQVTVNKEPQNEKQGTLVLQGWQVNKDGTRYVDPADQSAVILPLKTRRVEIGSGKDAPSLDDLVADAHVAVVERLEKHVEARKAIRAVREARAKQVTQDEEQDSL